MSIVTIVFQPTKLQLFPILMNFLVLLTADTATSTAAPIIPAADSPRDNHHSMPRQGVPRPAEAFVLSNPSNSIKNLSLSCRLLISANHFLQQFSISRMIVLRNKGLLLSLRSEKSAIIPTKID